MNKLSQLRNTLCKKDKASNTRREENSLTVIDNRTGKKYNFPIDAHSQFIKASDLQKIKHNGSVLRYYDPGYKNTMNCTSQITFIDGEKGNMALVN
jgi:citrate synthase